MQSNIKQKKKRQTFENLFITDHITHSSMELNIQITYQCTFCDGIAACRW